jgi:hypothetical protein
LSISDHSHPWGFIHVEFGAKPVSIRVSVDFEACR